MPQVSHGLEAERTISNRGVFDPPRAVRANEAPYIPNTPGVGWELPLLSFWNKVSNRADLFLPAVRDKPLDQLKRNISSKRPRDLHLVKLCGGAHTRDSDNALKFESCTSAGVSLSCLRRNPHPGFPVQNSQ